MLMRQISRGSPERIFVVIKNVSGVVMSIGRGVVFDYVNTAYQDGTGATISTASHPPGLLAGVVASHDIGIDKYGVAQCYGHVDSIWISSAAGSTNPLSGYDVDTIDHYPLYPIATTTGAGNAGGWTTLAEVARAATATWNSTLANAFAVNVQSQLKNYVAPVWLGTWIFDGSTTNTDTEGVTSGYVKGFIKGM